MADEYRYEEGNAKVVVTFEAPDLVVMRSSGESSLESLQWTLRAVQELARERGTLRALTVAENGPGLSREARKFAGEAVWPVKCFAIVSSNMAFRAMVNMITRGQQLLGKIGYPLHMAATEEDARRWLDSQK